jgi:RNase P subunit RPR2
MSRLERRKQARANHFPSRSTIAAMAENWVDDRDKAILETIYYCENCNMVLEPGDSDVERHKKELPHHKMRKVFIVRCGHCGSIVTDSHAQYSPERNQFWCKNCIADNRSGFMED